MKRYEYIQVFGSAREGYGKYPVGIKHINEMAEQGWRLIYYHGNGYSAIMEREICDNVNSVVIDLGDE